MTEDELIQTMLGAWYRGEDWETCPPGTSEKQNADFVRSVTRDMTDVLSVVREHDAARVPADAEMDGLVAWLSSRQTCTGFASPEPHVLETVYAPCEKSQSAADAITALRRRVAALEAERDKLRSDCTILLSGIDWLEECTGEGAEGEDRALVEQIRADLAPSDVQEGRADG